MIKKKQYYKSKKRIFVKDGDNWYFTIHSDPCGKKYCYLAPIYSEKMGSESIIEGYETLKKAVDGSFMLLYEDYLELRKELSDTSELLKARKAIYKVWESVKHELVRMTDAKLKKVIVKFNSDISRKIKEKQVFGF